MPDLPLGPNAWLIDEIDRRYREFPDSVESPWREYFEGRGEEAAPTAADGNGVPPPDATTPAADEAEEPSALPPGAELIRGVGARIVENMERSLEVPTATSLREIPVRLLEENRRILNQALAERTAGRLSFTHLIAWALMRALKMHPAMTASYAEIDGAPHRITPERVNFGLAVDVQKKDGTRSLMVPNVKSADRFEFIEFLDAYNDVLTKVRTNKIAPDDFAGTTITLTNPGMIGTISSIPRLMSGQGLIIAVGAIAYPAAFRSADPRTSANLGISKVMTMTSTYDHRVIQGAESGVFLQTVDRLLAGEEDFYQDIFSALGVRYKPLRVLQDRSPQRDTAAGGLVEKEAKVVALINMYRVRGHLIANTNPLAVDIPEHSELDPETHGLTLWDFDREFITGGLGGRDRMTLREIIETLREAYCQSIGVEYMHIQDPERKKWIRDRVEGSPRSEWTDLDGKHQILNKLNAAEAFEKFLHTRYVGHKRFSLEGAETLIPMLDSLFTGALGEGLEEAVIGMAHRGRLNVLANVLGKSYEKIFREFEGDVDPESLDGSGDVKYHLGATGVHTVPGGGALRLTLASNPSHLEAVNPVVEGMTRAKQDRMQDQDREKILPVLIHGDAAFAGQGVVAETLNLSDLMGYRTGGTVHIVVNNRIGFTTSPVDARSTVYPTDVARMVQAPVFHVNGNDPEACVHVLNIALQYRQTFKQDVVVDMQCYRKHGHNEGDEPAFTQPIMYRQIRKLQSVRLLYTENLVRRGEIEVAEADEALEDFRARLETAFDATRDSAPPTAILPQEPKLESANPSIETGVDRATLDRILAATSSWPESLQIHPKLARQLQVRARMLNEGSVDWAGGEALAFGSLLLEGVDVRLSGQDSRRGTFSHRHSALVDQESGESFIPLAELAPDQGRFQVFDSLLSEYAVMGFEYGYSVSAEDALILWEAQFGDFVNGAQIILDQFISSAEDKWRQTSRLVLLLPHGYEGQGPEHSSARLERFLTLCAERNMRVAIPTTAAQYFHLLRRQVHQQPAKPLVIMAPKSLLRAPSARSSAEDFTAGRFHLILDDRVRDPNATRLLLCSGKVAYDLMSFREEHEATGAAIIRVEQLYPFPADDCSEILRRYPNATDVRWVQEEPRNMGAWNYMYEKLSHMLPDTHHISFVGRPASGSPASGSQSLHAVEQEYLIQQAFFA